MRRCVSDSGFTLVEVLVALFIFSAASIALMTLSQDSISTVREVEDRYLARTIADSKMAEAVTDPARLQLGEQIGEMMQMGRTFTWVRTVLESGQPDVFAIRVEVLRAEDQYLMADVVTLRRRQK